MYRLNRVPLLRGAALVLIIAVIACTRKEGEVVSTDTSASTTAAIPADMPLELTDLEIGKGLNADLTLKQKTQEFGVRDTIYFVVITEGSSPAAKIDAKWTFKPAQTVNESSQNIKQTGGVARHEFHIAKASPWPKGDYKVEVFLDGIDRGTQDFTIK